MVVNQVDVPHIATVKAESDAPVCAHADRPVPAQPPLERMQPERGCVNILRSGRGIEEVKNHPDLPRVLGRNAAWVVSFVEPSKLSVLKATDHVVRLDQPL